MRGWALATGGLWLAAVACASDSQFQCAEDAQCGADGFCEIDGNCSFADDTCPSGRRYGDYGSQGLAGMCVQLPDGTGGVGTTTGSATTTSLPDSGGSSAVDDTGIATTASPGTTDGPPATGSDDGTTGEPLPTFTFFDDFERPDGPDLGNDWWEKTPAAVSLLAGQVVKTPNVVNYPDGLVLRPESETFGDLEAQITFIPAADAVGYPQLHMRVQPESDAPGVVTGYIF